MKGLKNLIFSVVAALAISAAACGGGGSNPNPPAISVSFSTNPPSSLVVSTTATVTATVSNDTANAGVTWSVTCGSSDCGSFNPASTPSGTATTYVAPAAVPTGNTVTIKATSVSDSTKSASATVTINAAAGISVSFASQPPATLGTAATTNLTAVVSGDSANAGVTWSVTCGSQQCGSFNPTTTASNVATVFTAPAAIPTGNNVTVKATSVTDTTKSATATIDIITPVLADGTYIFRLSGVDSNGPYYVAGAFKITSGAISGGELDFVDPTIGQTDTIFSTGSSVSLATSGNLQIVLSTQDDNIGDNGVITIRGTQVSASHALISEYDDTANATGTLDLQTSKAAPTGSYIFSLGGYDGTENQNALALGGVIAISGTTVNVGNSIFDYNDNGSVGQAQTFTSGTLTAPDSYGRLTISLTPSNSSDVPQFGLSAYIVGPNQIHIIENLDDAMNGTLGGTALYQGNNAGNFSMGTVQGSGYVFEAVGADANGVVTMAGGFQLKAGGTLGGALGWSDLSCCGGTSLTGNWTVDSLGRVTISDVNTVWGIGQLGFQLYLDGNGNALELGVDGVQVTTGPSFQQTGGLASGNYAFSAFGFSNLDGLPSWTGTGPVTLDGDYNWSGFTDYNASGDLTANAQLTGTTDTDEGIFHINGLNVTDNEGDGYGYYPIDGTRVFAVEVDNKQLGVFLIEMQNQDQ